MTDVTYGVYFNSGQNNRTNTYTTNSNITKISITNTDQNYYQTGIIELYNCSQQNVGDNIDIYINNSMEFSGYVARKQIHHKAGTSLYTYQLVGKTYDLWRYRTGKGVTYTGYSGYIASSLIHDYCTNIHGNSNITDGVEFENKIDLSDKTVGDALVTLIGYDGFKFYVDTDNNLVYYDPDPEEPLYITVTEDGADGTYELVDMSPIEEADEDLVNDVVVIGADNYYTTTEIPLPAGKAIADVSSGVFKTNMYIAQRVKAKEDTMSAVRMFLNRSTEPYEPENNVQFEVWDNTTQQLMNDSFNGGMENWSVTSNTIFEDGKLMLSYPGIITSYIDCTNTYDNIYQAQIIKPSITSIIDDAIIDTMHMEATNKTLWIEIRNINATLGVPSGSNGILCSGSVSISPNTYYSSRINLNPKFQLIANKKYAIVSHIESPATDSVRCLFKNYGAAPLDDYWVHSSDDFTNYNKQVSNRINHSYKLSQYNKSGYALSKPFGSPTRKIFNRYMKVELDDVTSSQRVYISGSNSGSKHYHTLTDGLWYDFGTENIAGFSSQVKIWLSGNGTYTPKVGSVLVSVADAGVGIGGNVFTDYFNDYTYLSGATRNKIMTSGGLLIMSGSKGINPNLSADSLWVSPTSVTDVGSDFSIASALIDDNDSTYTRVNTAGTNTYGLKFTLSDYEDISEVELINQNVDGYTTLNLSSIYISGNYAGKGYIQARGDTVNLTNTPKTSHYITFANDCVYYNVKKILLSGTYYADSSHLTYNRIFEVRFYTENYTTYSGSIQSKDFNLGSPIGTLKITPYSEVHPNKITYSGSKNSGTSWYKLTKNEYTTLGAGGVSGSHVKIMINYKPSTITTTNTFPNISTQILKGKSPSISKIDVEYAQINAIGGNLPKSGTKLERSSDIYIEPSDVPYPPSYSAWVSYTHPALRQNDGTHLYTDNYYWIIMHANSGATTASEHWDYYYDWNSDYTDGVIAYSTGNAAIGLGVGVTWKTWDTKPLWVPKGSLIMDIGWKGDEQIRATATNEQSINLFGRHQKIVNDSRVDSFALASSMANEMVDGMEIVPKKGWIIIEGVEGIKTTYKLSSNLSNIGIGGLYEIVSVTQNIDKNGFTTNLQYGKPVFDITKRIADIEKRVF